MTEFIDEDFDGENFYGGTLNVANNHKRVESLEDALYFSVTRASGSMNVAISIDQAKRVIAVIQQNIDAFEERAPKPLTLVEILEPLGLGAVIEFKSDFVSEIRYVKTDNGDWARGSYTTPAEDLNTHVNLWTILSEGVK